MVTILLRILGVRLSTSDADLKGACSPKVEKGKIKQYLKPYACRHSWISWQLENNVPIATVAKYAGNSPKTILTNYVSFNPTISLAPEMV